MSNNIEKDDNLTVSRVYETLKSPTFLKNLYWDILSGIKEKVTNILLSYFLFQILFANFSDLHYMGTFLKIYIFMKFSTRKFIITYINKKLNIDLF